MAKKLQPAPVQHALNAIAQYESEHDSDSTLPYLKKILPSLALKMAAAGEEVSTATLKAHIEKGGGHIKSLAALYNKQTPQKVKQQEKRSYQDVIKTLKPPRRTVDEQLIQAAGDGDFDTVKTAVENGADIHVGYDYALRKAAENGHLDVVRYLKKNGADIHANNDYALGLAAENGHLNVVRYLKKNGADIHANNDYALRHAAVNGHLNVVRYLKKNGAGFGFGNNCALRWAAENGHLDVVRYLKKNGADIHADCDYALRKAAENGHLDVVRYLKKNGADIRADKDYALRMAAENGHLDVVRYLKKNDADIRACNDRALRKAAENGHLDVVRYLKKNGADIHADNDCALSQAAANGHLDVVCYLTENDADIHADKDSALRYAAASGHLDVVRYLKKNGADIRACNDWAVCWAAAEGHLDMVRYLKENGADILAGENIFSENGYALRHAAVNGHLDVVDYLIKEGANAGILTEEQRRSHALYNSWVDMHGHVSVAVIESLREENRYWFKPKVFDAVCTMLAEEGYNGRVKHHYAYHISGLFGSEDRVLRYLEKWGEAGKQPLHDIAQMIKLPKTGRPDLKAWGDAIIKQGPKLAKFTHYSDRLPVPLRSDDGRSYSYLKTKAEIAKHAFTRVAEKPEFAVFCLDAGWDNNDFDNALEQIANYTKTYGAPDAQKPKQRIPDITIDGSEFSKAGYKFYKLPDGDERGLLLGEFTNCCQHLAGEGSECAAHGYSSEEGGFYVVAEDGSDKIIAQSWAWRGTKGELTLDSLESLSGHFNADQWTKLCTTFSAKVKAINANLPKPERISAIHIGTGGATPEGLHFPQANPLAQPIDYSGYRDSENGQYCVSQ